MENKKLCKLDDRNENTQEIIETIAKACDASKVHDHGYERTNAYWWSDELAELRRKCIRQRRMYTRARKRKDPEEVAQLRENFYAAKKTYSTAIKKAKQAVNQPTQISANNEIVPPPETLSKTAIRKTKEVAEQSKQTRVNKMLSQLELLEIKAIVNEWTKPLFSSSTEKL